MEDVVMRTVFDFSPLYRSSIGFDRIFGALEAANRLDPAGNWPPYDIVKTGENDYRITMAIAGFSRDELTITHEPNLLMVSGQKAGQDNGQYLHHGIAERAFQRRFELADHVKVLAADLENGLLTVDLKRELPEEMKPRRIKITTGTALSKADRPQIDSEKRAA
jgi:molecular chaperone IbpA